MPLIIVTGFPCSGKTKTAENVMKHFERRLKEENLKRSVRIVTDSDILDFEGRDEIYGSPRREKELRAWLRAETQRYLNLNQIVIMDAAAYIKGFRYELHCLSKEAKTQYCVVEKLIETDTCWKWNEARDGDPFLRYKRETFDALQLRYEKCDDKNRWDCPLIRIETDVDEETTLELIYHAIIKEDPLKPNKSTQQLN